MAAPTADECMIEVIVDGQLYNAKMDLKTAKMYQSSEEMMQNLRKTIKTQILHTSNEKHTTPTIPTSESKKMELWTTAGVKLLITTYSELAQCFKSAKYKKKDVWKTISEKLQEHGHIVTGEQCNNKWKLLMKQYKNVVDNNTKSGRGRISCQYYNELEEILGWSKRINPKITLNSNGIVTIPDEESPSTSHSEGHSSYGDTPISPLAVCDDESPVNNRAPSPTLSETRLTGCTTPLNVRKRKRTLPSAYQMSAYLEHCKKAEEAKERRHKEKLEAIRQNNALIQQLIDKL